MNQKKYKKAIQEYEKILEIIPKHVSSRIEIGNAYTSSKEYDDAIKYYNQALELEPNNLTVYYPLINMELSRENLRGVKKYLDKGFEIDPNDIILLALKGEYYYRLGTDLMKEKKWNPSLEQFNEAISIWKETLEKVKTEEWKEYAREGIKRAESLIKEVKKVRW
jgi:tetratricopeptide (TPR) repeat protein